MFFRKKEKGEKLTIDISLNVAEPNRSQGFVSSKCKFDLSQLPQLKKRSFEDPSVEFFQSFEIYYSVENNLEKERSISTGVCIDNRAVKYDLVDEEVVPHGYQLRFLFVSDFFNGKSNPSRQKFELPDGIPERNLKIRLKQEMRSIIEEEIPSVSIQNNRVKEDLHTRYPHLVGYFQDDYAGMILKGIALEEAQKAFFNDQKTILECNSLDDSQYNKALELSSRALSEYVMYRTRIIEKLKGMDCTKDEKELHKLIVPMRRTFRGEDFDNDVYNNNIWMLDDRFMSYSTILSDKEMSEVIKHITLDEVADDSRPDITLVFSGNPTQLPKFDVVVVELKKHGLPLAKNEEVISQLRQRARKLLKYFPKKIERIWFYGITDIDAEFRISLREDGFKQLFSHGQMFFKPQEIYISESEELPITIDLFVMTYEAFINDAESRNKAFLSILRSTIRNWIENRNAHVD